MAASRWLRAILVASLACALPIPARAGGFAVTRFGGESGHPTTAHPAAIYYNPAGLALGTGTRVYVEELLAYRRASYQRPAAAVDNIVEAGVSETGTPEDAVAANSGKATLANFVTGPFAGVVTDLGVDNLGAGLALYAPFGGSASWDQNQAFADSEAYPGAVDGVQRWSLIDGELEAIYVTLAGAYRFPKQRLSVGVGVNLVTSRVAMVSAHTAAGTDDMVGANGSVVEGRALVEANTLTAAVGGGVIWQPARNLWLGASYQSQPGFGENRMRGTLTTKFGAAGSTPTDIYLVQSLPDVVRIGARYRRSRTELHLSGDFTRWSVFDKQCLLGRASGGECTLTPTGAIDTGGEGVIINMPRNFDDTFGLQLGGSYRFTAVELGGGLRFDSNAVPDDTLDAAIMDAHKLIASADIRYALFAGRLTLAASYAQVIYFEREVDARERDADGEPITYEPPSRFPDNAGTYEQSLGLLSIGLLYAF